MRNRSRYTIFFFIVLGTLSIATVATPALAQPLNNPANGHYYIAIPNSITWIDANATAQSMSFNGVKGHLATVTSQAENDFIVNNLGGPTVLDNFWLGGFQQPGSAEPAGGWQWVSGEPWVYTNWYNAEPGNGYGGDQGVHPPGWPEDALHLAYNVGQWNDFPSDIPRNGFIVEYDTPTPSTTSNPTSAPAEFFDDFERYSVGTFPSSGGWELIYDGTGAGNQVITSDYSVSPSKSLQLWGSPNWASTVQKHFSSNSSFIGYGASILISAVGSGGPTRFEYFGFHSLDINTLGKTWAEVHFDHDTLKILAEDESVLGNWTPGVWYSVRVVLDRTKNTYDIWINGQQKGLNFKTSDDTNWIDSLCLLGGHPGVKVYYDDVSVFEVSGNSPSPSTSPSSSKLQSTSSPTGSSTPTNAAGTSPSPTVSTNFLSTDIFPLLAAIIIGITVLMSTVAFVVQRKQKNRKATAKMTIIPPPPPIPPVKSVNHVFISHVEEDAKIALEIAHSLEKAGYETWHYERDSVPGTSYILKTSQAIEQSQAVILIISANSLGSHQVHTEVITAHEAGKPFIPVLKRISHAEFQVRQPEWRRIMGSATSISVPKQGISAVLPRIVEGLEELGIKKVENHKQS